VLATASKVIPTALSYRLTFLLSIIVFISIKIVGEKWGGYSVADFFANISCSLYIVHPVLGYAIISVLVGAGIAIPVALLSATLIAIVTAVVLHILVEVPTHRLGQRWARSLHSKDG
jgi:peptidoglycan/LPS O-acetylase OafA/YrhL